MRLALIYTIHPSIVKEQIGPLEGRKIKQCELEAQSAGDF
jgi:hypothetical protein